MTCRVWFGAILSSHSWSTWQQLQAQTVAAEVEGATEAEVECASEPVAAEVER